MIFHSFELADLWLELSDVSKMSQAFQRALLILYIGMPLNLSSPPHRYASTPEKQTGKTTMMILQNIAEPYLSVNPSDISVLSNR